MKQEGKVAIVTGASSVIGARTSLEFGGGGAKVCCLDTSSRPESRRGLGFIRIF